MDRIGHKALNEGVLRKINRGHTSHDHRGPGWWLADFLGDADVFVWLVRGLFMLAKGLVHVLLELLTCHF